ncbi:CHASE2 domain-containing protein, partial [Vibrio parahaemolyticus]|nr:CHASE2 domain-containing protein [Vibrio parahaemolyticus]
CADADGKIRRFPDHECQPDRQNASLSSEVASAYANRRDWNGFINYRLGPAFSYRSIKTVLEMAQHGDESGLRQLFDGKIVLIGSTQDYVDILN